MLVGFTVENYASFRDQYALSMLASGIREHVATNVTQTEYGPLLKSAIVYGANAAGKSNLFQALWFMRKMVGLSILERELPSENEHFRFSQEGAKKPTLFELTFIADSVQYRYGFQLLSGQIHQEWLYRKIQRETLMFERTGPSWETIDLKGPMKSNEAVKKHTREDSLFISVAGMLNDPIAEAVTSWFESLFILRLDQIPMETIDYMADRDENRQTILEYLRRADIGIDDVSFSVEDIESDKAEAVFSIEEIAMRKIKMIRHFELNTLHSIYNRSKQKIGQTKLPFYEYQSDGTISLFGLLGPVLLALAQGRVVLIDELGARLHPNLTRFILSLFNSIDHNQNGAQLIGNTHDVLLLEENMRRDQVWFVQKDAYGASEFYSLHDFVDTRQSDLFMKKYLLGVFGAIPRLGQADEYE